MVEAVTFEVKGLTRVKFGAEGCGMLTFLEV